MYLLNPFHICGVRYWRTLRQLLHCRMPVSRPSLATTSSNVCSVSSAACKMVNGFRYYRALESVGIASALSTALTIYPCQIRVHQRWQSKLQLPTARKKEWRPTTAGSSPHAASNPQPSDRWSDALPVLPPSNRPATSASVERIFSHGGIFMRLHR